MQSKDFEFLVAQLGSFLVATAWSAVVRATMGQQSKWDGICFDEMIDKPSLDTPFLVDRSLVPIIRPGHLNHAMDRFDVNG